MLVAEYSNRNGHTSEIYLKENGLWKVEFQKDIVQNNLTDLEIVRYLANALENK